MQFLIIITFPTEYLHWSLIMQATMEHWPQNLPICFFTLTRMKCIYHALHMSFSLRYEQFSIPLEQAVTKVQQPGVSKCRRVATAPPPHCHPLATGPQP